VHAESKEAPHFRAKKIGQQVTCDGLASTNIVKTACHLTMCRGNIRDKQNTEMG